MLTRSAHCACGSLMSVPHRGAISGRLSSYCRVGLTTSKPKHSASLFTASASYSSDGSSAEWLTGMPLSRNIRSKPADVTMTSARASTVRTLWRFQHVRATAHRRRGYAFCLSLAG